MTKPLTLASLEALNAFRAAEGKAPFGEWRKARHQPMLDAYYDAQQDEADADDEPDALISMPNGDLVRESELSTEEASTLVGADKAKTPAYKVIARQSGHTSSIEKPVEFVHAFCTENPGMSRKETIAALVAAGVNYSTARTQYQKWFAKKD